MPHSQILMMRQHTKYGSATAETVGRTQKSFTILSGFNTFKTVGVKRYGFTNYAMEKIVSVPTLRYVGDYCFWKCKSLIDVSFLSQLAIIPNGCFSECISLQNVEIPSSITSIGDFAFQKTKIMKIKKQFLMDAHSSQRLLSKETLH